MKSAPTLDTAKGPMWLGMLLSLLWMLPHFVAAVFILKEVVPFLGQLGMYVSVWTIPISIALPIFTWGAGQCWLGAHYDIDYGFD